MDYRGARALRGAWRRGLVLVVVIAVSGVAVAVVDVVNVVAVGDGNVAAAFAVGVLAVWLSLDVLSGLALVPVAFVLAVDVAIVHEVGVILVWEGNVAAAFTVSVLVFSVGSVSHNHESFLRFVVGECPFRFHSVFIKSCFQYGFNSAREIFDIFSLGRGGAGCVEVKT